MKLGIRTWALLCGMLPAFGFSAFIQSPIPPSTSKNFFKDMNGDSQMDQVEIVFLGNLSREYLDSTVARLELNWKDRNGISQVLTFPGSELPFNASNVNSIVLDLSQNPNLYRNTSLTENSKTAKIVFRDSSELPIVTIYAFYLPVLVRFMIKGTEFGFCRRFLLPALAICGSLFMIYAAVAAHGVQVFAYLIVFSSLF